MVLRVSSHFQIANGIGIRSRQEHEPAEIAATARDVPAIPLDNIGFTFEALMVCADAHKRAGSTNGTALADAVRTTKIDKRVMVGGPIEFNTKGQCNTIASVCLQNRNQTPTVVLPKDAAVGGAGVPDAELEPARLIFLVINPLRRGEGERDLPTSWY